MTGFGVDPALVGGGLGLVADVRASVRGRCPGAASVISVLSSPSLPEDGKSLACSGFVGALASTRLRSRAANPALSNSFGCLLVDPGHLLRLGSRLDLLGRTRRGCLRGRRRAVRRDVTALLGGGLVNPYDGGTEPGIVTGKPVPGGRGTHRASRSGAGLGDRHTRCGSRPSRGNPAGPDGRADRQASRGRGPS